MKRVEFDRYSATGNLLLILDAREIDVSNVSVEFWSNKCRMNEADGIILLNKSEKADYRMVYRNVDGGEVNLCGNGLRVLAHFAFHQLSNSKSHLTVETNKGIYETFLSDNEIKVRMVEIYDISKIDLTSFYDFKESIYLNTGVPHCVFFTQDVEKIDVKGRGRQISHNRRFKKGSNVNFVQIIKDGEVKMRTYERGVESETLSCGSGAMAIGIALSLKLGWKEKALIHTRGGDLMVEWDENYDLMYLTGKVEHLSHGVFEISGEIGTLASP